MTDIVDLSELSSQIKKLKAKVSGEQMVSALSLGGLLIMNRAKGIAPYRTGTLRRSIHVGGFTGLSDDFDPSGDGGQYGDIGGKSVSEREAVVLIGSSLEYSPFVEFGTSKMKAQPFLRPAADQTRAEVLEEIRSVLAELVEDVGT